MLAVVQGLFPHGEQCRSIAYERGAIEVVHDRAAVKRLTAVRAPMWDRKSKFYNVPVQQ